MSRFSLFTILSATFLALAAMYAPQPLLPLFAEDFGVSQAKAATLITWSLLPMGLAPLGMGLLLQRLAPRRLLAACVLALGLAEIAFALTDVFAVLSTIRLLQGAIVSALLAATMTYIAGAANRLQHVMAYFIGASVLGGLSGRILVGTMASRFGLPPGFLLIGGLLVAVSVLAWFLPEGDPPPRRPIRLKRLFASLSEARFVRLYGVMFMLFFAFTALLNFLPFRLGQLAPAMSSGAVGLAYSGFVFGLAASVFAVPIAHRLGGELRAVVVGAAVLAVGVGLAGLPWIGALIGAVCAASAGLFFAHAVLSGYVNAIGGAEAASVSSLYVAFYYTGGTLGSYVPGLAYEHGGWGVFIGVLLACVAAGLGLALWARRTRRPQTATPAIDETPQATRHTTSVTASS